MGGSSTVTRGSSANTISEDGALLRVAGNSASHG